MAINETKSTFLAGLDERLRNAQVQGLSWLEDRSEEDSRDLSGLLGTYETARALPAYDEDGVEQKLLRGIWVSHPPFSKVAPPPVSLPPTL